MSALICPSCGSALNLMLGLATNNRVGPRADPEVTPHDEYFQRPYSFTVAGRRYELALEDLRSAIPDVSRPIYDSYVEIADDSGEVKQVATKDLIRRAILRKYPDIDPQTHLQPGTGFQSQRAEQIARGLGLHPLRKLSHSHRV